MRVQSGGRDTSKRGPGSRATCATGADLRAMRSKILSAKKTMHSKVAAPAAMQMALRVCIEALARLAFPLPAFLN